MKLELSISELEDLAELVNNERHIQIQHDSLTIAVDAKEDDTLHKGIWLAGGTGGKDVKIDKLGIYEHSGLKIWVVKR